MKNFAEFIRKERIDASLTLREFCRRINYDASNWSKIERGVNPPPQSSTILDRIARALGHEVDSEFRQELNEIVAIEYIPENLIDQKIKDQLPVFFRTVRGEQPSKQELEQLIKSIKKAWTPTS